MLNALIIALKAIGIGALLAIPGVALGFYWHKRHGWSNHWMMSLSFCILIVLMVQVWFPTMNPSLAALLIILGSTIGMYQREIWDDMRKANHQEEVVYPQENGKGHEQ